MASVISDSTRFQKVNSFSNVVIIEGGAIGGVLAGIAMALIAMVTASMMGAGFLAPMKLIAATFYGAPALEGGARVIMAGLGMHVVTSAIFGITFAFITRLALFTPGGLLAGSTAFGVAIWALMTYFVLPAIDPVMRNHLAAAPWFIEHVVFGMALGLTPFFERHFQK
jgi:hypothetical protein